MRQTLVLLGAGFTRNWGGWIASEAQEYLLGHPQLDEYLRGLLWKCFEDGIGFEGALAQVLTAAKSGTADAVRRASDFQEALRHMFRDMHEALHMNIEVRFSNEVFKQLLIRFEAVFTLNQDLLLEMHYTNQYVRNSPVRTWQGVEFPGLESSFVQNKVEPAVLWTPKHGPLVFKPAHQPIMKLHGSSNWITKAGDLIMIMGDSKLAALSGHDLLSAYFNDFKARLLQPGSRLMVVGYGFGDEHVNEAIRDGLQHAGLEIFVVDPLGLGLLTKLVDKRITTAMLGPRVIGASRRSLSDSFAESRSAERKKILRFFE